jgi:hypothetical protein
MMTKPAVLSSMILLAVAVSPESRKADAKRIQPVCSEPPPPVKAKSVEDKASELLAAHFENFEQKRLSHAR